ncbi:MAG: hypothetical protein JOZ81_31070, partial [Chloroflexi bacterium]|nr:hypothetical protein [Chloroflexota bacterium]
MRQLQHRFQAALADSIIYEEHKGNFAAARLLADSALAEARASNVSDDVADAFLERGVVHILQCEPAAAVDSLKEVGTVVPSDAERKVLAAAYSGYAANLQLNLFPDEGAAHGAEWEARLPDLMNSAGPQHEQVRHLVQQVTEPAVAVEVGLVSEFLINVLQARRALSSYGTSSEPERQARLAFALTALGSFWSQAESLHAEPQLFAYMMLASADLCRRSGEGDQALELLENAYQRYRDSGDLAGSATCLMTRGDWCAAPLSTPLLWNHAMREGAAESELPWTVEASEFAGSNNISVADAQSNYAEAERLFREVGAARGLGALELRYGFLAALAGEYEQALGHAMQAGGILEAAGDIRATWIAHAHQGLALVGMGRIPEPIARAEAIGSWGAREGSFSFALGLGLLFERAGRRWLTYEGDYERSLSCYRLAEALFGQLKAPSNLVQNLVDQGNVYRVVGHYDAAMRIYERAWNLQIQAARMQPPRPSAWARTGLLVTKIHQIVVAVDDVGAYERQTKRLEGLIAEWPSESPDLTELVGENVQDLVDQARVFARLGRAIVARDKGAAAATSRHFKAARAAALAAGPAWRDLLEATVLRTQAAYPEAIAAFNRYLDVPKASSGFMGAAAELIPLLGAEGEALAHQQQQHVHAEAAAFFARIKAYELAQEHLQAIENETGPEWWSSEARPWEALSICADVDEGLGLLEDARRWADRAIAALEDRRRLLSRDELKIALSGGTGSQYLYFQAARITMKLRDAAQWAGNLRDAAGYSGQAFGYAERGKARALLDLMAGGMVPRSSTET